MVVFITCKNAEVPFKNEGARVVTTFLPLYEYGHFSRRSRAAYSAVHNPIRLNFKLSPEFTAALDTCKKWRRFDQK